MIIILSILFVRTTDENKRTNTLKQTRRFPQLDSIFKNSVLCAKSRYYLLSGVVTIPYSFLNNSNLFATGTKVATVGEGSNKKIAKENSRKK